MWWIIAAILVIIVCFLFVFLKKNKSSTAAASGNIPVSKTPVDLSVFDQICEKEGTNGGIDFWPISDEDNQSIKELFSRKKSLTSELINRNYPVKIVYTDNTDKKTLREIIPYRIVGSVEGKESDASKEYDFYIEAYCLMRNEERSFHTNGISAAWFHGRENNLGDYLLTLYRKAKQK